MKKIFYLLIALFITAVAFAQQPQGDTSYHLLWYKGKKIKTNELLTQKGNAISYTPAKGEVNIMGTGKKFNDIQAELNKTPQRIQEMVSKVLNGVPKSVLPVYSFQIKKAFAEVKETYSNLLTNAFTLPETSFFDTKPITKKGVIDAEKLPWEEAYKEFHQFMAAHTNEQFHWLPVPPRSDFTYNYNCDKEKQKTYKREMEKFIKELTGEDDGLLKKALGLSRQANLLLKGEQLDRANQEVNLIVNFILGRLEKKVAALIEEYIDKPYYTLAILQIALLAEKQFQLMSTEGHQVPEGYRKRAIASLKNLLQNVMDERDYTIGLNLRLILSVERLSQVLTGNGMRSFLDTLLSFSQFKLNADITGKLGSNGGWALAAIKGTNWFYAIPDSTCRLQWCLVGPYENRIKMYLEAAELKGNGGEIIYAGTKDWNGPVPNIKIDFCNNETDSMVIYPFKPDGNQELWQFPKPIGIKNIAQVNTVLLGCFTDSKQAREEYAYFKNPANIEKVKAEMMAKYKAMLKSNDGNMAKGKGAPDFSDLGKLGEMQQFSKEITSMVFTTTVGKYVFTPTVPNKEKIIAKDKINGKELFPQNTVIEYALFNVILEHDADGPYKVHL